jgi:hypothetical protein
MLPVLGNNFLAKYGEAVGIGWDGDSDWKRKTWGLC